MERHDKDERIFEALKIAAKRGFHAGLPPAMALGLIHAVFETAQQVKQPQANVSSKA